MNTLVLSISTFVYFTAFVLLLTAVVSGKDLLGKAGRYVIMAGFVLNGAGMALRWIESYQAGIGHAPLANFYESLVFFSWSVILLAIFFNRDQSRFLVDLFATALAFLFMAYASFSPTIDSGIQPLIPALKSNWLIIHVMTCFLGYAAFVMASGVGILILVKGEQHIDADHFGEVLYQSTAVGFVLFSFGIITGSVWAYAAWGRYWGWDPKETWALITWLVYAAVIHAAIHDQRISRRVVILTLIGLACVLFTYIGVNYLSGLHSYQ